MDYRQCPLLIWKKLNFLDGGEFFSFVLQFKFYFNYFLKITSHTESAGEGVFIGAPP